MKYLLPWRTVESWYFESCLDLGIVQLHRYVGKTIVPGCLSWRRNVLAIGRERPWQVCLHDTVPEAYLKRSASQLLVDPSPSDEGTLTPGSLAYFHPARSWKHLLRIQLIHWKLLNLEYVMNKTSVIANALFSSAQLGQLWGKKIEAAVEGEND